MPDRTEKNAGSEQSLGWSRLLIEYDGSEFAGWAKQPGKRTVQSELEHALETVRRLPTKLTVAGRTDRGVHAWGQVASHEGKPGRARSLNAVLPDDISVIASDAVEDLFDAREHATSRTYCYRIYTAQQRSALQRGKALWWSHELDRRLLTKSAKVIEGKHDFSAFTIAKAKYNHYGRTVARAQWIERTPNLLEFWIEADAFMRRMVRSLVGFQLMVAGGKRPLTELQRLLDGGERLEGGYTAKPHGLYLAAVGYPNPLPGALAYGESPW